MNTKKILGVVAVLALVAVAMVGAGAAATEVNNETDLISAIGTDEFDVILTDNITLSEPLTIEKCGTLDLGGYTLSVSGTDQGVVNVKATFSDTTYAPVCIKNGTIGGEDIYWGLRVWGTSANEGLKDYEFVEEHLWDGDNTIVYVELCDLKIYGSVFGLLGNGASHGTYIDAKNCIIKAFDTEDSIGIYHPQSGVLNLTNCTVEGYSTAVEVRAGNVFADTCTLKSTCLDYVCVANSSGTTTKGAAIAMNQHTTNLKSRLWLYCSTISAANGYELALANTQNATSESVIEIGSMNVNVYVDDDDGNIDMTFKVAATTSQGIDDCVLNFMNKKWKEIKDSVIYGGAGCVITTTDSTKRFYTTYNNVEGDSPVSVDECINDGTVVSLDIGFSYVFTIPPTVCLSDTEGGSKNADFTFTATQKLEGYNAVVSVLTEGQGDNDDEYYVKAGTKTATYVLNETTASTADNLMQGSEILNVDLDSDKTGNQTIYFITTVLPGFSGSYTGTIEFNAEIVQDEYD